MVRLFFKNIFFNIRRGGERKIFEVYCEEVKVLVEDISWFE